MSLQDWLKSAWVVEHKTTPGEIQDLLAVADRDLSDCQASGLSPDWQLNIAYNAALQLATAALAAAGYRAGRDSHHFRIIQSLEHTLQPDAGLIDTLEAFRKKRNIGNYERAGVISDKEAKEMFKLAKLLRGQVETWLRKHHPELIEAARKAKPRRK